MRDSSTTKLHSLLQSLDVEVSIVDLNLNSLSPLSLTSTKISVVMAFARKEWGNTLVMISYLYEHASTLSSSLVSEVLTATVVTGRQVVQRLE